MIIKSSSLRYNHHHHQQQTLASSLRTRNNKRSLSESDEEREFSDSEDSIASFSSSSPRYARKDQQTPASPTLTSSPNCKPAEFPFTLRARNQSCQKNQKSPSLPTSSNSGSSLNKKPSPPSTSAKKRNRPLVSSAASVLNCAQTHSAALMEKHILFGNLLPYPQSVDLAFVGEREGCREFICLWNAHFAAAKDRSIGKEEWIWRLKAFFVQLERREFRGYFKYLMLHFVEYGFMSEEDLMIIVK